MTEVQLANANGSEDHLWHELEDKEFRDSFVAEHVRTGLAFQIGTLREQRDWSQSTLAHRAGTKQSVISRLENPEYGRANVQTLLDLAAAFDVGLLIRFVSYEHFLDNVREVSSDSFLVPSFSDGAKHSQKAIHHRHIWDEKNTYGRRGGSVRGDSDVIRFERLGRSPESIDDDGIWINQESSGRPGSNSDDGWTARA